MRKPSLVPPLPTPAVSAPPVGDLLGDDDGFTPYVQAANLHSPIDEDFGHFHEAPAVVAPVVPVAPSADSFWPTSTSTTAPTSTVFDPFGSVDSSGPSRIDLLQPMSTTTSTTNSKPLSNEFDVFSMAPTSAPIPNQPQPSTMFFPQQPMMRPAMFPQTQSMTFSNPPAQPFVRPNNQFHNNASFHVSLDENIEQTAEGEGKTKHQNRVENERSALVCRLTFRRHQLSNLSDQTNRYLSGCTNVCSCCCCFFRVIILISLF